MIKLLLADDHNIVRNGLKVLLEKTGEFIVAAEARDGMQAKELLAEPLQFDLALIDINMPLIDGMALIQEIKQARPQAGVVILSMLDKDDVVCRALKEGVDAYLLKNTSADELIFALKHVHSGKRYICSELVDRFLSSWLSVSEKVNSDMSFELSSREREVLQLMAQGYTNQEISDKIFLSKRTVEGHRQSLIDKTGSRNTAALIRFAMMNGLIA